MVSPGELLVVLAAVQTCVRGTAPQEDRTARELRPSQASQAAAAGGGGETTSPGGGRFELRLDLLLRRKRDFTGSGVTWLSKVHNTPVINTPGTVLTTVAGDLNFFV